MIKTKFSETEYIINFYSNIFKIVESNTQICSLYFFTYYYLVFQK